MQPDFDVLSFGHGAGLEVGIRAKVLHGFRRATRIFRERTYAKLTLSASMSAPLVFIRTLENHEALLSVKRFLCGLVLLSFTACGNGSSTPSTGGTVCPTVAGTGTLVYPASGSTAVVDSQNVVVVAGGLGSTTLILTPQSGAAINSTTTVTVPNPLPSPSTSTQATPVAAFTIPTLASGTTYTVTTNGAAPCDAVSSFGSFTTQ